MGQIGVTTTDMENKVTDFSVDTATTDGVQNQKETFYDNPNFSKWYGYYNDKTGDKGAPGLKKAIDAFATWVLGQGFTTQLESDKTILERITGKGEESFLDVMWNMKVIAKVNGDSYAEIIRNENGDLLNLRCLSPENMRIVYNDKGIIIRYEQMNKDKDDVLHEFKPTKILHFSNDRVADELGGVSVVPAVKWDLDARQEAKAGYRRALKRSSVRILFVAEGDITRLTTLKTQYESGLDKGEVVIITGEPKDYEFIDLAPPNVQNYIVWISYLDNQIFLDIGTPKVIMGSVDSIPESGGKISYLSYEQIYKRETRGMEADIWNQLDIRVSFIPPASIVDGVADEKSTAQTGFQPNDVQAGVGK